MCCCENRRTCLIGITIVCIIITLISAVNIIPGVSPKLSDLEKEFYGDHEASVIGVKVVLYVLVLVVYTVCLIGAFKRKPLFLLPFMVLKFILIFGFVIGAGIMVYYGALAHVLQENAGLLGIATVMFICHWLCIYFLYVAIKLHKEFRVVSEDESDGTRMQQIY